MHKFLYLLNQDYAYTWINGGSVPVSLASRYLSNKREGVRTPDENLIHESNVPIPSLKQFGLVIDEVSNFTITNSTGNGVKIPNIVGANFYTDDGLILSFCNTFSTEIAKQMNKKACVKILDFEKMKKKIDRQLGCKGVMKAVEYTTDHNRNHFLKSIEDSWQDEYRIFWKSTQERWVTIPKGTAELVALLE